MNLLGWEITRRKKALPRDLSSIAPGSGGWFSVIRESFTGAWQRNIEIRTENVLTYSAVFSCISLISADISKLRIRLVAQHADGIWREVEGASPFWPVLRKPNRYQTRIQFYANWIESKLIHGNTFLLKERDNRGGPAADVGVVRRLYILDPTRVTVLCAPDGSVFYRLDTDRLSGIAESTVVVPASEIIHDRWNTFYHPLVGISPISAAGLAATQGLNIQRNSTTFFENGAQPGGILTAPGLINQETAQRIESDWMNKYGPGGSQRGAVAVLGDGLHYEPLMMSATDSDVINQLKWTAETVVSVFHVPAYKVGIAPAPTYNNIEALNQAYYTDCLQILLEAIELLLDEGLELPKDQLGRELGTEFDVDQGLFRMDSATRVKTGADAVRAGIMAPDEARERYLDLGPVDGGDTPYMQHQQYSLAALAERDADKPFSKPSPAVPAVPGPEINDDDGGGATEPEPDEEERAYNVVYFAERIRKKADALERAS